MTNDIRKACRSTATQDLQDRFRKDYKPEKKPEPKPASAAELTADEVLRQGIIGDSL
jgi:hypothetical protein